jgi:uncharacterized membrane protein
MAFWLWLIAAAIFLVLDLVWLTKLGRGFYLAEIGALLLPRPKFAAAAAFYLLYVTGLVVMVIKPAYLSGSVGQAAMQGALLGLVAYGTYDLTNLAVMKGFTLKIALIDLFWGTFLTAVTAALTVYLAGLPRLA